MINQSVTERFLRYVKVDTQADPESQSTPSTQKQIDLSKILSRELDDLGIQNELTKEGYVYATIESNSKRKDVPTIFFCSHVDLSLIHI